MPSSTIVTSVAADLRLPTRPASHEFPTATLRRSSAAKMSSRIDAATSRSKITGTRIVARLARAEHLDGASTRLSRATSRALPSSRKCARRACRNEPVRLSPPSSATGPVERRTRVERYAAAKPVEFASAVVDDRVAVRANRCELTIARVELANRCARAQRFVDLSSASRARDVVVEELQVAPARVAERSRASRPNGSSRRARRLRDRALDRRRDAVAARNPMVVSDALRPSTKTRM